MARAGRKKTARKRSLQRRRRSATEVALASLAHEIRTPLTGILALAELLHASDLPEREQRWAEAIRSAADHLARLTAAEPHATAERLIELEREAAKATRQPAAYTDVTVSFSKSISVLHASIRENTRRARVAVRSSFSCQPLQHCSVRRGCER